MSLLASLLRRRDIWKRIALERLTEPLHLNALGAAVAVLGDTRTKILFDLLVRPQHAYGLLHAADQARAHGCRRASIIELGVGSGTGLLNLCELGARVTRETGVDFDIVGFDTGHGLPPPRDYRDHPELYKEGWFPMQHDELRRRLPANARLVLGPLADTVDAFVATLSPASPVGFVSLDVDLYSSSTHALRVLLGPADRYFPYVTMYVDDIALPTNTRFAGELLAITEFNAAHELRKIDPDWNLVHARVFKHAEWLTHMHKIQILDHPVRGDLRKPETIEAVPNPYL
jgi:hypothetical protein